MAIGIYFDGRRLIRPQAVTKIDDSGMFARGLGGANTLALLGECTGGQPGVVQWFTDPSYAKAILRSGPLLQALQRAYAPSAQDPGAYLVGTIRVNPATQAAMTLKDSLLNPLVSLTSVDYGAWNNQIKFRLETGTVSGTKKVTITYGTSFESGDNIGRSSIYIALADPKAVTGTVSVSKSTGLLTTTVVSDVQKGYYSVGTVDLSTAMTGGAGSPFTTALDTGKYLYIASDQPFRQVNFTIGAGTPNAVVGTMSGEFFNGTTWTAIAGLVDGTASGGAPLAQTGNVTFTLPTAWARGADTAPYNTFTTFYWIRLKASVALTAGATMATCRVQRGLSITLGNYQYIQQLLDYIDAQPGYEVVSATTKPDSEFSTDLDDVTGTDMLAVVTYLTAPYTTGRDITVNSNTAFAVGDYVVIARTGGDAEETRRISSKSGSNIITLDSALSTSYNTPAVVRKVATLYSNLQAVIDWVNTNSALIIAGYASTAVNRATVQNVPDTYLEGGTEGVTTQTEWDAALELLQNEDTPLISTVSYDPAVWASLSTHCTYMSGVGKKERIGFVGGFDSTFGPGGGLGSWNGATNQQNSINKMIQYAQALNTDRICYIGLGFQAYDENGLLTTYPGSIAAALVAGMAAGVDVAEALTHDSINVIGLEYNFRWADLDRLLEGGILPLEFDPGHGYRVCQSITTWLRNDKYNRRELSVRRTSDYVARQVRERLERDFVGSKGTTTTLISIKNATISTLTQMVRLELLAGDATNPPFKNIQCRLEGDTCYVEFEASPVIPINYIPITVHLTVFTTTMTA